MVDQLRAVSSSQAIPSAATPPLPKRSATTPVPVAGSLADAALSAPSNPDFSASLFPPAAVPAAARGLGKSVPAPATIADTLPTTTAAATPVLAAEPDIGAAKASAASMQLSAIVAPPVTATQSTDAASSKPAAAVPSSALFPTIGGDAAALRKDSVSPKPVTFASASALFPPIATALATAGGGLSPAPSCGGLDAASGSLAGDTSLAPAIGASASAVAAAAQPASDVPATQAAGSGEAAAPAALRTKRVREPSLADTLFPALSVPASVSTTPLGSQALSDGSMLFPPAPAISTAEPPMAPSKPPAATPSLFPPAPKLPSPSAAASELSANPSQSQPAHGPPGGVTALSSSVADARVPKKASGTALDSLFPPAAAPVAPVTTAPQKSPLVSPRSAASSPHKPASSPPSPGLVANTHAADLAPVEAAPQSFKRKRYDAASDPGAQLGGLRGNKPDAAAQRNAPGGSFAAQQPRITPPASPRSPLHWRASSADRGSSLEAPSRPGSQNTTPRGGRGAGGGGQGASVWGGAGRGVPVQHGQRGGHRGSSEERAHGSNGGKDGKKRRRAGKGWSAPHSNGASASVLPPPPPLPPRQAWRSQDGGCVLDPTCSNALRLVHAHTPAHLALRESAWGPAVLSPVTRTPASEREALSAVLRTARAEG